MEYKLSDLIDIPRIEKLVDYFYRIIGLPIDLTNAEGQQLISKGGQDICREFHRAGRESCLRCVESDKYVKEKWREGRYLGYRCLNGLMEYAAPIVVEDKYMGTVFTGQILHEPPDEGFFRKQAIKFGFDQSAYLKALRQVPIIPASIIEPFILLLAEFGELLAYMGLERIRQLETQNSLREARDEMETKVRERTRELHAMNQEMQSLSRKVMQVQEDERRRLARELHDEVGQALTAIKINLEGLKLAGGLPAVRLEESVAIVDDTLQEIRNLAVSLRPSVLDDLGLDAALRNYLATYSQRTGLATELSTALGGRRLPRDMETACFRVTQEALTNVVRHSRAGKVQVALSLHEQELHLLVADDGMGFDVKVATQNSLYGRSVGLLGMKERVAQLGGQMMIESDPTGGGTRIHAIFPLAELGAVKQGGLQEDGKIEGNVGR